MVTTKQTLTASEIVLMAAADLTAAGKQEFSEWDLTVAAWTLDRLRFGLRGYTQQYPDHKRVMMEIMGQKVSSPVQQKYLEKVRPNHYRLTALGRTAANLLRPGAGGVANPAAKRVTVKDLVRDLYAAVSGYVTRPEFRRWQANPEEPRDWGSAAAFLGLVKNDTADPVDRLAAVRDAIQAAMDWCRVNEIAVLDRGPTPGSPPIHVRDLAEVLDFLQALTYRFPEHLEKKPAGKHKKRFD